MPNTKTLPRDFVLNTWDDIKPYYDELVSREINSAEKLKEFIDDCADLSNYVSENYAWRYIKQSCNTLDEEIKKNYEKFVDEIQPERTRVGNIIDKKINDCSFSESLDWAYCIFLRSVRRSLELFREENIPLQQEETKLSSQYDEIVSQMSIIHEGKELTMSQAWKLLKENNRALRKEIFDKMIQRRSEDYAKIQDLLDKLIALRNKIAKNCWFVNYAEYKHYALERFDYSSGDVNNFCQSIINAVNPITEKITKLRQKLLWHELLPYDFAVSVYDKTTTACFKDSNDLVEKLQNSLNKTYSWFWDHISRLQNIWILDLESRKWKAPWWYNYPLDMSDLSFIFMNAVNDSYAVFTMVHEAGHALHHKYTYWIKPSFQRCPWSEVCEIASMAQELLSMDKLWDFFPYQDDFTIAVIEKIEKDIDFFAWMCKIDQFQKWIYANEWCSHEDRNNAWLELCKQYPNDSSIGSYISRIWEYDNALAHRWQNQMHIFDVPMYYVEYWIASLGAIAMRKQYLENPQIWIENYIKLLKVWNTKPMPEIFAEWWIKFDFSKEYIMELMTFMQEQLELQYKKLEE